MSTIFYPRKYQVEAINLILNKKKAALFIDMGGGKSVTALSAAQILLQRKKLIKKVLIVAPATVAKGTWHNEIKKWVHTQGLSYTNLCLPAFKRKEALQDLSDIHIISRDLLCWLDEQKNKPSYDFVVFDESTSFKNRSSQRSKAAKNIADAAEYAVLLTGTPCPNSLEDIFGQMLLVDKGERLGQYVTHFRWKYFVKLNHFKMVPKRGAFEDVAKKVADVALFIPISECAEIPENQEVVIPVTLENIKFYKDFERARVLELTNSDEKITAVTAAALFTKLQQVANGFIIDNEGVASTISTEKLDALKELVEQSPDENWVIFYNFIHDKEAIKEALKHRKLGDSKTKNLEAEFNSRNIDTLILHASQGFGLNLQESCNRTAWFGLTPNLEHFQQANKRVSRPGQKRKTFTYFLLTEQTIDCKIRDILQGKDFNQNSFTKSLLNDILKDEGFSLKNDGEITKKHNPQRIT